MIARAQGFDFKVFQDDFPFAKISAVADNMAAALGVAAHDPGLTNALVIVLGTAPAVATFFRDASWGAPEPSGAVKSTLLPGGVPKFLETGIWQSWVWFNKIDLDQAAVRETKRGHFSCLSPFHRFDFTCLLRVQGDIYGYHGGVHVARTKKAGP